MPSEHAHQLMTNDGPMPRIDLLLQRARTYTNTGDLPQAVIKALRPSDLTEAEEKLNSLKAISDDAHYAAMMLYISDGLQIDVPSSDTIKVYYETLQLPLAALDEIQTKILQTYRWNRFPPIETFRAAYHSTKIYREINQLESLTKKIERFLPKD